MDKASDGRHVSYRLRVRYNITIIIQSRAYWRIPNMVINVYALHVYVQSYTTFPFLYVSILIYQGADSSASE